MRRLIPCLLLLLPALAAAESPWRLGVAMGYGERSNPLINSDDLPIILDLDIAYFGKYFFFDNGDLGPQRKLYYRELIARFGHHLALNWNLGEEVGLGHKVSTKKKKGLD